MMRIPQKGRDWSFLKSELEDAKKDDFSWRRGRMALYYYYLDEELKRVQQEAYCAYWNENNMAHRAFPSLKRLEGEVVEMGLSLLHAPPGATATFTSGGSESIFLALKTARDWARAEKGVTRPKAVVPRTCHPTFTRAAHYLGIEVVRVRTSRNDFRADVAGMAERIDADTIMLMGSAPNYPFGVFDPIADIAALAQERGLWMHVDACVGGFLAPFVRDIGHDIPAFDFAVPGVTSISADLHKYGMAAWGASLMLLREQRLKDKYQIFTFDDWERGAYMQPTAQGARPGGAVAAAWAVMNYLGMDGYHRIARIIMETKRRLTGGINAIPGLAVLEPNELSIFVYRASDPALDIGAIADGMAARGWFVGRQAEPKGIHLALNPNHEVMVDDYLADLRAVVAQARGVAGAATAERSY
ncbi:MAG: aspartate aminotransferase family protein [Alphaproteobacteria bacterium]|nr:aspartate aminotransferase family protein [Alphaproteobacteria bacterium]